MIQAVIGLVLGGFLVALVVGLATGRIAWRQQGCCPADPADDLRMTRASPPRSTAPHHPTREPQ